MKKRRRDKPAENEPTVILLRDLAPRADVTGGSRKILFGQRLDDGGDAAPGRERAAEGRPKRNA